MAQLGFVAVPLPAADPPAGVPVFVLPEAGVTLMPVALVPKVPVPGPFGFMLPGAGMPLL